MYYNRFLLFLLIFATMASDVKSQCSISQPFQDCTNLFRKFQEALFENKDNIFVLQSVFYPPTQITPVLVKFIYKLNTTCQGLEVSCPLSQSTICNDNGSYTFGWTTREIYKIFHPSVINQLRLQLPFWLLQISENIHNLTEEYDVEAFLWDGVKQLPSANLSLDIDLFDEQDFCECSPMKEDLIKKALGELTQWLKAYAKLGQGTDPALACPEEKAIALHCAAVEKYNRYSRKDRSSDAKFGTLILRFAYSVGFILTFFMAPLFLGLLFKIVNKAFDENNPKKKSTPGSNDRSPSQLESQVALVPESKNDHYRPMFAAALVISFMYSFASISIAFYNLPNKSRHPLNEFELMKTSFLVVLVVWLIILDILYAVYYWYIKEHSSNYCMKMVLASFAVFSLGILAADVMISIPPTILLLFAYPIDSSALLALHIAIFYCATMVLAVYFTKIHKWITEHYSVITGKDHPNEGKDHPNEGKDHPKACIMTFIYLGWFAHIFLGLVVLVALPITYICIMFFYQFVVARSNTSDISLNGLSLYIPSVVIAIFGFVIKKGAFEQDTAEKKKKKEEQRLIAQAQKIWTVVGHRLGENDKSKLSQMEVGKLAKKLKGEEKE